MMIRTLAFVACLIAALPGVASVTATAELLALPDPSEKLVVFPDPFYNGGGNKLFFVFPMGKGACLNIFSASGDLVASPVVADGEGMLAWDGLDWEGKDLASGVYLASLRVGAAEYRAKFVMLTRREPFSPGPGWLDGRKKEWAF